MRAGVLHEHDAPPVYGDFAAPEPVDGHVVVDVEAAGVNHVDLAKASGRFYLGPPPLPSIVGADGVGRLSDGRVFFNAVVAPYGLPPHGPVRDWPALEPTRRSSSVGTTTPRGCRILPAMGLT